MLGAASVGPLPRVDPLTDSIALKARNVPRGTPTRRVACAAASRGRRGGRRRSRPRSASPGRSAQRPRRGWLPAGARPALRGGRGPYCSQRAMSVTYMRVRTTFTSPAPRPASARSMIAKQRVGLGVGVAGREHGAVVSERRGAGDVDVDAGAQRAAVADLAFPRCARVDAFDARERSCPGHGFPPRRARQPVCARRRRGQRVARA